MKRTEEIEKHTRNKVVDINRSALDGKAWKDFNGSKKAELNVEHRRLQTQRGEKKR